MLSVTEDIHISIKKMPAILGDVEKAAKAVKLVYVQDSQQGISRKKLKSEFGYFLNGKRVSDPLVVERIRKLAIPPAWTNVWICPLDNGHLQATGLDTKKRKQYRYHSLWNKLRNHTKFYRLHEFGKAIPRIRQQLEEDLAQAGMPLEKVLAVVVSLMEQTSIRIGNNIYEKLYGSFGLTTLKNRHVNISGNQIQFTFKGKKGIFHKIQISDRRLAKIVKQCREIPGKELFQYIDDEGNHKLIDSGMVNSYIKSIAGEEFTAKDFRTWAGTLEAIKAFKELAGSSEVNVKQNINLMLDSVSKHLGNTRSVCRKYYIHPAVISLYEKNKLDTYFGLQDKSAGALKSFQLTAEEQLLIKILEKETLIC